MRARVVVLGVACCSFVCVIDINHNQSSSINLSLSRDHRGIIIVLVVRKHVERDIITMMDGLRLCPARMHTGALMLPGKADTEEEEEDAALA